MFYIYNETSKQLEITNKSERVFHIGIKDPEIKFGVDILVDGDTTEGITEKYNVAQFESLEAVQIMAYDSYKISYNYKSGNPILRIDPEVTDNSYDAYLLVYKYNENEDGMKLFNEKRYAFNVLFSKHDTKNNIIYVVGAAKPNKNPKFFLTFANENAYNTKHLMFNRKSISVVYNKYYTAEEAKQSKFAALITTPASLPMLVPNKQNKPFAVIVGPWVDDAEKMNNIMKTFRMNEKYVKKVDINSKQMINTLKDLKNNEHYNCISVVTNQSLADINMNGLIFIPKLRMVNIFRNVNYITADYKIYYKK